MATQRDPVDAATTPNAVDLGWTGTAPGFPASGMLDGVVLTAANRVLIKDQFTPSQNGIYVVMGGPPLAPFTFARASDMQVGATDVAEAAIRVSQGAYNAHSEWVQVTPNPDVGATFLQFATRSVVVDPRDYGSCPGDETTDCTQAVLTALGVAQTNTASSQYPNYRELRLPPGAIQLTRPLRITTSNFILSGCGKDASTVRPAFQGPWCVIGPSFTDVPPVKPVPSNPQGISHAFFPDQGRGYRFDLRACRCGEIDGATAFTCEAWIRIDSAITGDGFAPIAASIGKETNLPNIFDVAFIFGVTGQGGIENNLYFQSYAYTGGGQNIVVTAGISAPTGSWIHVAVDWDGSTIRLLVNGSVVQSTSTAGSSLWSMSRIFQQPWEGVYLAAAAALNNSLLIEPNANVVIGPTRCATESKYSTKISENTYPPPSVPFPSGSPADLWVINWDLGTVDPATGDPVTGGDSYGGYGGGGRPAWFPTHGSIDLLRSLSGVHVRDLKIYSNNGAAAGGIFTQMTPGWRVTDVDSAVTWYGIYSTNNSYEATFRNVSILGCNAFACVLDFTTSGDLFDNCNIQGATYPILGAGGIFIRGCVFGNWGAGGAAISFGYGLLYVSQCFWDAEVQLHPTRGAVFVESGWLQMSQCEIGAGSQIDQAIITLSASDADINGTTSSVSYQSGLIDVISAAPNRIVVRLMDYGTGAPRIMSSTNTDLGKIIVESGHVGDPVNTSYCNAGKVEQRHGSVNTANATPMVLTGCTTMLDRHSSYAFDVEVHAETTDGDASATWKISDAWKKGALGDAPVHNYTVSSISAGTNAGAVPTGWSVSLVASGTSTVIVQVTGTVATNMSWTGRVTATRLTNSATTWTPIELAPAAWFRGDVGAANSWVDQSGNGNNAAVGTTAPTTATLAGWPAFDFAGGAWFESSASSLLTGGGSCTILAIAQAVDDTGGAIFCSRAGAAGFFDAGIHTKLVGSVLTTHLNSGGGVNTSLLPSINSEAQRPFVAEWSIYDFSGFGRNARFQMNRRPRLVSGYVADESGATGFFIGKNGAGTPWNGVIAELVVLDRALTASERTSWEAYANARYGAFEPLPWTPASFGTALRGWYRADAFGTDLSGTGNMLTMTGTTPGGGLNGHPTVIFNGTSDHADLSALHLGGTGAFTTVLVCKLISASQLGQYGCFFGLSVDSLHFHNIVQGIAGDNPQYDLTTPAGTVVGAGFKRYVMADDGTTAFLYVDGSLTDANGVASTGHVGLNYALSVGSRQLGGALFSNIEVAEFLVIEGVLGEMDRVNLDTYLRSRYGI